MAQNTQKTIAEAAVYFDGVLLLGGPNEVEIPEVNSSTTDFKSLGMPGTAEIVTGTEKMQATLKLNYVDSQTIGMIGNRQQMKNMMVRSVMRELTANGYVLADNVYTMKVIPLNIPGLTLKAQELAEFSVKFAVYEITHKISNVEVYHFSTFTGSERVNGVDVMQPVRNLLGT